MHGARGHRRGRISCGTGTGQDSGRCSSLDGGRRRAGRGRPWRGLRGNTFPLRPGSPAVVLGQLLRGAGAGGGGVREPPQAVLEAFPAAAALRLCRRAPGSVLSSRRHSGRGHRRPVSGAAPRPAASPRRLPGAARGESIATCVCDRGCGTCWRLLTADPPPRLRLRRVFPPARGERGAGRSSPCRGGARGRVAGSPQPLLLPYKVPVPPLEHHVLGAVGVLAHCGDRVDVTLEKLAAALLLAGGRVGVAEEALEVAQQGGVRHPAPGLAEKVQEGLLAQLPGHRGPVVPRPRGVCVSPSQRSPAPAETPAWSVSPAPRVAPPASISRGLRADPERAERVAGSPRPQAPRAAQVGESGSLGRPCAPRAATPLGESSRDRPEPASPAPWQRLLPGSGGRAWPASSCPSAL